MRLLVSLANCRNFEDFLQLVIKQCRLLCLIAVRAADLPHEASSIFLEALWSVESSFLSRPTNPVAS